MAGSDSNLTVRLARPDEAAEAVAIWREVALWLIERGQPLWSVEQFDDLATAELARVGWLALGFKATHPVAVMTIQDEDRLFWPEAAPGSALYLHKLAVRRGCAGQGWAQRLIDWARASAQARGRRFLRLDCSPRPQLTRLYEAQGFSTVDDGPVMRGGFPTIRYERTV